MGPSGEDTPPPSPPGFPFPKSSKSRGKKPMITSTGEPPPRPRPRPRPPPGSVSRAYREDTCSSFYAPAPASFYSSRHPGESSSAPYRGDASAIVCGGNTISPCCQGDSAHSPPPFADGEFPVGLRVLLVDDDQICLTIVSQLLTECRYKVTCCNHPRLALSILRERKGEIDVVITDVYMPEIDGFKLLELVATEMDIPVVMMSVDCGVEVARRGIENGACYYLMKPVSKEELRNVWQHVFLWKKNLPEQGRNSVIGDNPQANNPAGNPSPENPRPVAASRNEDNGKPSKRPRHGRESEEGNCDDNELNELGGQKKHRVIWSAELHGHFLKAVNELGYDKAVPKKILELMNVPGITRENIASHLQKYRIFLRRLSSDPNLPLQPTPRQTLGTAGTTDWPVKQRSDLSGNRHCAWKVVQPGFFLPGFPLYIPPQSNSRTTKRTPNASANDNANANADATLPSNLNPTNQFQYTSDPADPTSSSSMVPADDVFQLPLPAAAGPLEDFQQTLPPLSAFNHMSPSHASLQPHIAENPNPEFGMDLNLMAMSPPPPPPPSSSSFGVGPTSMVDQEQLLPPGFSTSTAPFGGYQGWRGVGGGGNNYHWQGVHAGSSFSSPSMLSYSGIPPSNYTGLCMTSTGGLYGLTRTGPIVEASGCDNSIGSQFDEMRKGKMPMVEEDEDDFQLPDIDFTDFNEDWICFNDMPDANRPANTNQGDQEKVVTTENDVSDGKGIASLRESSLPLYSDNEDFDEFFFQKLEGLEFSFPDFDFGSFNLDDNRPPAQ